MSLLHTAVSKYLMKNRVFYDPDHPKDYVAQRQREDGMTAKLKVPKGVTIRQEPLGGVPAEWITAQGNPTDRIVLYIHGGGFCTGSSVSRRAYTCHTAHKLGLNVVSLDYRLAPEHPFPQGPEDCLRAYRALLERWPAKRIVLAGESAGGNLVLSTLLQSKAAGLPLPAATFALSPTVQYDRVLDSYQSNLPKDCIVTNLSDEVIDVYLCSKEEAVLKNPAAAPYYGDYRGCTPVVLWASEAEVLYDDSRILFDQLKAQNVPARLYLRKGMLHAWPIIPQFPESKKDLAILGRDMKAALDGTLTATADPIRLK